MPGQVQDLRSCRWPNPLWSTWAAVKDEVAQEVLLVGDGTQHWATVHADDLGDLYALALEQAAADQYYLGASGGNPTVRELGEAASHSRPVREQTGPGADRRRHPSAPRRPLRRRAPARPAGPRRPRSREPGRTPTRPTLAEELASGGYSKQS